MATIEYLGGVPRRAASGPIAATVRDDTLQLRHSRFFGGWSYRVALTAIDSAELATAQEVRAGGLLPEAATAELGQSQGRLLAIVVGGARCPTTIILRGPWPIIAELRQEILRGRMRAARQWHA